MRFMPRAISAAFALSALISVGLLAGPAAAQQDSARQQMQDIRNMLGFGKENPPVDYSDRPPLVVPPSYELPRPGGADPERLGVNDPDVAARRRALANSRRPVPPTDPGAYAQGSMQRKYLVDPPSGMRDPGAVAADISHDNGAGAAASPERRTRKKRRTPAPETAAQ